LAGVKRRLPPDSLATVVSGSGCLLLADPEGPGRGEELELAAGRARVVLGPTTEPEAAAGSWSPARSLLAADADRTLGAPGLLRAEDHLADLLLFEARPLTARIALRRLAALAELTPKSAERMRETALAHVRHHGNAVAMANELHIHPQTARYR